jgi:hypothetical protein
MTLECNGVAGALQCSGTGLACPRYRNFVTDDWTIQKIELNSALYIKAGARYITRDPAKVG